MGLKRLILYCLMIFSASLILYGQESRISDAPCFEIPEAPNHFFGQPDLYLDWQSQSMLNIVESILTKYPPSVSEPQARKMAIVLLDAVFHDVKAPHRSSVQKYHIKRTLSLLDEIETTKVDNGVKIWKLYNMGVVARTKSVTIAFDIIRGKSSGSELFVLPTEIIDRLASQCDALFISHIHGDHADLEVAKAFLERDKPVITPKGIWMDSAIYDKIIHLDRKEHIKQSLKIKNKKVDLDVVVYPGHQGEDILNNVVLVYTPEKYSICHTGDQSFKEDYSWIDNVSKYHRVDILLPNCWVGDPLRVSKGFNPKIIIPTHENELGHTIDHREAYTLDYHRWDVPYEKIIMTWGESFHYAPNNKLKKN